MNEITDQIWRYNAAGKWTVISVNGIVRNDGTAVMGKGIALQAKSRFPRLEAELGAKIKLSGNHVYLFPEYRIITMPVKEHWQEPASLELIAQSCQELLRLWEGMADPICLPRLGCGSGQLLWADVKLILEKYFDDRFTVVDWSK